jgi:nitroimidazol reductase NimA-like FMN-containing flavoprotein (pyridoxamine 5'-phosphate oxidase superfamily)
MTDLPQPILDYLTSEKLVTLATASADGTPHARTYMYVNDGLTLYVWARPSSTTAQHLNGNAKVSFAIDEYVDDWNKAKGLQGDGTGEPVAQGDGMARAIELFADKFPAPSSGASTTNIAFFQITPTRLTFIDNEGQRTEVGEDEFGVAFHHRDVL